MTRSPLPAPAHGDDRATIVLGAAGPGSPQLEIELDGERVVTLRAGWSDGAVRDEATSVPVGWVPRLALVERAGLHAGLAYCRCVERLLGIELPERGEWLRILLAEWSRIAEHWRRFAGIARVLDAALPRALAVEGHARAQRGLELLSGSRDGTGTLRIGGVRHALDEATADRLRAAVPVLRDGIRELAGLTARSPWFAARLRGVGLLTQGDCLALGITGPGLRAAGVPLDLRKEDPGQGYGRVEFDVPVGESGDAYDRLLVCLAEVEQSAHIVDQCLDAIAALGPGPIDVPDPRVRWPSRQRAAARVEDRIHHYKGVTEGPRVPAGEAYAAVESPIGELGCHAVADGRPLPVHVHLRSPQVFHLVALERIAPGAPLADVMPTLASLHADGAFSGPVT